MGQALYRKYRSKSLDAIVGQEHITDTLKRAIESGRIAHAYLFTGPRGVGKTSIARLLAHELNKVPYVAEDNHLDIIEIDAASNGGVEEIRDLRDKVHIAPSAGKYKVYIIDEVHMMTTSAFNALLKTLEEPPAHVIFILATTEAHKLPATIVSRTQRFTFKPIAQSVIAGHLRHIADEEHIHITDEALQLIAAHSDGSFRDGISMLDQAGSSGLDVDVHTVEQLLGIPAASIINDIFTSLTQHDAAQLIELLQQLRVSGFQAGAVAKQLAARLRQAFLDSSTPQDKRYILTLLERLIDVPASSHPEQLLEVVLLDAALGQDPLIPAPAATVAPVAITPAVMPRPAREPIVKSAEPMKEAEERLTAALVPDTPSESTHAVDETQWQTILTALGKQYNTLYGIIRMARPEFSPGHIRLTFGFSFHQKRANDTKNKQVLMAVIENITGQRLTIECLFDKDVTPPGPAAQTPQPQTHAATAPPDIAAINTIFGGGEVLPQNQ